VSGPFGVLLKFRATPLHSGDLGLLVTWPEFTGFFSQMALRAISDLEFFHNFRAGVAIPRRVKGIEQVQTRFRASVCVLFRFHPKTGRNIRYPSFQAFLDSPAARASKLEIFYIKRSSRHEDR
jgi:hypothetical protein